METTQKQYINATETAKYIRNDLKRSFPGTKFSVTSEYYSMGSSVNIRWTDGATEEHVRQVCSKYCGDHFDGMIDMSYDSWAWVDDGVIVGTGSYGTIDSAGSVPPWGLEQPTPNSAKVHFSTSVSYYRELSEPAQLEAARVIASTYGYTFNGDLNSRYPSGDRYDSWGQTIWRILRCFDLPKQFRLVHRNDVTCGSIEEFWSVEEVTQ